jgi:hypothetical protein
LTNTARKTGPTFTLFQEKLPVQFVVLTVKVPGNVKVFTWPLVSFCSHVIDHVPTMLFPFWLAVFPVAVPT